MIEININPVAFRIGPFTVMWYGIMVLLAVVTIVGWLLWQVKKGAQISFDSAVTAAVVGIPSGLVFSRLLHVIDYWEYYGQHLDQVVGGEGLSIYGAVLGAALGIWIYSRFSDFNYGYFTDLIAPAIILAQAIGRVGCTINGCCYGLACSLPWGVIYTNPASSGFADSSVLIAGMALHPTHVYEIIYNLLVFVLLLKLRGKFRPEGSLFLIYLTLYALWRFAIDFIREGTPFLFGLHQAQVIGLMVLAITVPLLITRTRLISKSDIPDDLE